MIRFERGHRHLLAGQLVVVAWRRRGGEHAHELVRARFGALATSGRAVE
jgi:hypothetical protein